MPESVRVGMGRRRRKGLKVDINRYIEIRRSFNALRREAPAASRVIFDEFAILCTLHDRKGLSATQLAEEQGISCPTMTHRGNHLDQLGYLARIPSLDDRRRLRCSLTRRGLTYVNRTCQAIIASAPEGSSLAGLVPGELIPIVARMGTVPMTADSMTLLCFAVSGEQSMPIMRIVEATELLQPTISMAVLRLEGSGCIERPEEAPVAGRRPMRRSLGCVLTEQGTAMAAQIAEAVRAL